MSDRSARRNDPAREGLEKKRDEKYKNKSPGTGGRNFFALIPGAKTVEKKKEREREVRYSPARGEETCKRAGKSSSPKSAAYETY